MRKILYSVGLVSFTMLSQNAMAWDQQDCDSSISQMETTVMAMMERYTMAQQDFVDFSTRSTEVNDAWNSMDQSCYTSSQISDMDFDKNQISASLPVLQVDPPDPFWPDTLVTLQEDYDSCYMSSDDAYTYQMQGEWDECVISAAFATQAANNANAHMDGIQTYYNQVNALILDFFTIYQNSQGMCNMWGM